MIEEIWRDIPGYEQLYQVSNLGRVKSLDYRHTGEEKILKNIKLKNGYLRVSLYKEGKVKHYLIHRLVSLAFLDNPDNLPQLNHRDEDKTNNCVDNLEWCNCSYNSNYGSRNERVSKTKSVSVFQFSLDGEFIRRWDSATEVEKELGFNHSNISLCCRGERKTCGEYIWRYEKEKGVA